MSTWIGPSAVRAAKKPEDDPAVDENPNGGNRTWIVTLDPWREVFARVGGWERQIPGVPLNRTNPLPSKLSPRGPYSDPSALPTHRPSTPQTSRGDFSMPETTETFLACHEWDTPLGARGKGRDLLTSGSSFSRQARLGQGINPPPKLHGRREPGAPRTHSQRALGARGPDEEPNRQPDPQAQRSARVSTRPPLHRRALPTTAQPEEEPGRNGGTRSYKKPSATVEPGVRLYGVTGN